MLLFLAEKIGIVNFLQSELKTLTGGIFRLAKVIERILWVILISPFSLALDVCSSEIQILKGSVDLSVFYSARFYLYWLEEIVKHPSFLWKILTESKIYVEFGFFLSVDLLKFVQHLLKPVQALSWSNLRTSPALLSLYTLSAQSLVLVLLLEGKILSLTMGDQTATAREAFSGTAAHFILSYLFWIEVSLALAGHFLLRRCLMTLLHTSEQALAVGYVLLALQLLSWGQVKRVGCVLSG